MRFLILWICLCWTWPATAVANDMVQVRLLASNLRPYLGESLVLTMEITRPENLRQTLSPAWPKMTDLAVEENLPSVVRRITGDDEPLIVENLRRVVRPLRSGTMSLEQTAISIGGRRQKGSPLRLSVRPLPTASRPADFSGAVGRIETQLDMEGSGRRKISLLLRGAADLSGLSSPLVAGNDDRLVLLADEKRGRWPKRERWLQYLLIPADHDSGELQLRLNWFDPDSMSYEESDLTGGQKKTIFPGRGIASLSLLGVVCLLWLIHRWRSYRCLRIALKQKKRSWPEQQLLNRLRQAGAPEDLLEEAQRLWRLHESGFAREHQELPPTPPCLPTKLVWKLSARIDKRALHQP